MVSYDRAGRSEGLAYVTYSNEDEARIAVEKFDGANANGQPIRVKVVSARAGGGGGGNGAGGGRSANEGKSLFDRISSRNDGNEGDDFEGVRRGGGGVGGRQDTGASRRSVNELRENAQQLKIDRYIPGDRRSTSRDRRDTRPPPRGGRGGERERRGRRDGGGDRGDRGGRRGERNGGDGRPRKTAEELDAEMNNYWSTTGTENTGADAPLLAENAAVPVATASAVPAFTVTEPASTFGNGGWSAKDAADFEMMD